MITSLYDEKGVVIRDIDHGYIKRNTYITEHETADLTDEEFNEVMVWLKKQIGKGYDFINIFTNQTIHIDGEDPDKWMCSEIVIELCQRLGVEEFKQIRPEAEKYMNPNKLYKRLT